MGLVTTHMTQYASTSSLLELTEIDHPGAIHLDSQTNGWPQASGTSHQPALEANTVSQVKPTHSVLIVEDDPDIAMGLQDFLEFDGFKVDCAKTCRDAFLSLEQHTYDAVLLDLGLPDGDGRSILETLHVSKPSLPVIVLSASDKELGTVRPYARLRKPWRREEFRRILHRALETVPSSAAR